MELPPDGQTPILNMVQSINQALDLKLGEDPDMVLYGEDVGVEGGVFRVTEGLQKKHGKDRVFDTPLSEDAIAGTASGMAMAGLRPVVEMQFSGFAYPAFNQMISHIARIRNRTRGRYRQALVIRMPYGGGINALEHHSESMEALYAHIPGLKVVIPSTPYDAKGLLISAVESDDPVIFMEPKRLYRAIKQEVPEGTYRIPLGKAALLREGEDLTLIAYGALIREAQKAAEAAAERGISVEVMDLRTLSPFDEEALIRSVKKTGRFIFAAEEPVSFGIGAEICSFLTERAFLHLEAPPRRVSGFDTLIPYPQGEHWYMVNADRILYEIERTARY